MLDKGIIERIVLDYKDIYKQAIEDDIQSPAELPYFEGDFWPNVMEENIREMETEMEQRKKVSLKIFTLIKLRLISRSFFANLILILFNIRRLRKQKD